MKKFNLMCVIALGIILADLARTLAAIALTYL